MNIIQLIDTIAEMEEGIQGAEECCFEFAAENANEVALFGDSGPGSALRLAEMRRGLREHQEELAAYYTALDNATKYLRVA